MEEKALNELINEELILRNVTEELDDEVIRKLLRYNNIPEEEKEFVIANLKELYKINGSPSNA